MSGPINSIRPESIIVSGGRIAVESADRVQQQQQDIPALSEPKRRIFWGADTVAVDMFVTQECPSGCARFSFPVEECCGLAILPAAVGGSADIYLGKAFFVNRMRSRDGKRPNTSVCQAPACLCVC